MVVLLLVVRGGTVCLPMPPSWPEVSQEIFLESYPLVIDTLTVGECIPISYNSEIFKILDHGGEKYGIIHSPT